MTMTMTNLAREARVVAGRSAVRRLTAADPVAPREQIHVGLRHLLCVADVAVVHVVLARENADVVELQLELELSVGRVDHGVRRDVLHDGVLLAQLARALPLEQHLLLVRQPAGPRRAVRPPPLRDLHDDGDAFGFQNASDRKWHIRRVYYSGWQFNRFKTVKRIFG